MLKKSEVLKQIREQTGRGIRYTNALKHIRINGIERRISEATVIAWRRRPMIERYCQVCMRGRENKIIDIVEDTLAKRCMDGTANPAEIIFYLCNKRPDVWKRRDGIIINQSHHFVKVDIKELEIKPIEELIRTALGKNNGNTQDTQRKLDIQD